MNSNFLSKIGLENLDLGPVILIILILLIVLIVLLVISNKKMKILENRLFKFCGGDEDARHLEDSIAKMFSDNIAIKDVCEKNRVGIRENTKTLESTYQKMGLVRYDAFAMMGGKLSFALCLLNEKNDGFILNSIHGNDGCYTYAKEIRVGVSTSQLGDEEQRALDIALHS